MLGASWFKLPLWLVQNRLERGGHVFEPKSGLKSRALSKAGKSPTNINDPTEPILSRPTLTNGNWKINDWLLSV